MQCYKCHAELTILPHQTITRSEACPKCLTSIRCCMMCIHYDKNSYNECRESVAERAVDKEKANFCDFYSIVNKKNNAMSSVNDLKAQAEALFKKKN